MALASTPFRHVFDLTSDEALTRCFRGIGDNLDLQIEAQQSVLHATQHYFISFRCSEKRGTENLFPVDQRVKHFIRMLLEVLAKQDVVVSNASTNPNAFSYSTVAAESPTFEEVFRTVKHDGHAIGSSGIPIPRYVFGISIQPRS